MKFESDITDLALLQGDEAEKKLQLILTEAETYSEGLIKANEAVDAKSNVLFSLITALILFLMKAIIDEYLAKGLSTIFWVYSVLFLYYFCSCFFIIKTLITEETSITGRAPNLTLTLKNISRSPGLMLYHQLHSLQNTIELNQTLNAVKARRLKRCMVILLASPLLGIAAFAFNQLKPTG